MSRDQGFKIIILSEVDRPIRKPPPPGGFSLVQFSGHQRAMGSPTPEAESAAAPEPTWLQAGDALGRVQRALGDRTISVETIVGRLRVGLARSTFVHAAWENTGGFPAPRFEYNVIPSNMWKYYRDDTASRYVWATGDLRLALGHFFQPMSAPSNTVATFFGVKIERQAIDEIIANAPPRKRSVWIKPTAPQPITPPEPEPDVPQKGPAVAPDHLKAWFDLYRRAYAAAADTEETALSSARGMFPGKSVSRERVRALRGEQRRGRKPSEAAK
jgi:hypothetical protein